MSLSSSVFAQLADRIATSWRPNCEAFARDLWNFIPDSPWQRKVLRTISGTKPQEQKIAMQSCAGPGKTALEAIAGWYFLLCQGDKYYHPNGMVVSVSGANLKGNLWKELRLWYDRSPLLQQIFAMTTERIFARDHPGTWWLEARTWPKSADPTTQANALSGLHGEYILVLIDEAGDIAPAILRKATQALSTGPKWGKIIVGGNPTSLDGLLYEAVTKERAEWTVFRITADPESPDRTPRIPVAYARNEIKKHGRDNAWVKAFILGEFPPSSINALLGPDDVNAALERGLHEEDYIYQQKRLGIDVARFGDDRTVIFPRQGLRAFLPKVLRNARSHDIAAAIAHAKHRWGSEAEFIDDTGGWGAGAIDACLLGGIALIPVNVSSKRTQNMRYFNVRSEINFMAAEWIKRGGALPQALTEIVREATAVKYWFEDGKFRVTEKDQIKIDLEGTSPDLWDALCLTFAMAEMPAQMTDILDRPLAEMYQGRGLLSDYDPLDERRWS